MVSRTHLAAAMLALSVGSLSAEAQQRLPQPIVLYRSPVSGTAPARPAATTRPVSNEKAAAPVRSNVPSVGSTAAGPVRPGMIVTNPGMTLQTPTTTNPQANAATNPLAGQGTAPQPGKEQTGREQEGGASGNQSETKELTPEQEWRQQQSRPTNQMLQNPSGGYNLSHSGFTSQQQMTPNTYFGQQFQAWTNQQAVGQMQSSFGEMSRFQPGASGAYVAPNTYLGSGFSNWSNLNQGGITPGATGSWDFSTWR